MQRASHNQGEGSEEDDYEVIGENRRKEEQQLQLNLQQQLKQQQQQQRKLAQQEEESNAVNKLPTAMELIAPVSGRRTLWCELPQVINSGLLGESTILLFFLSSSYPIFTNNKKERTKVFLNVTNFILQ